MDEQQEFYLKQIERLHQNNKIRGSQEYMNYIGNNYEFLFQLIHEQEKKIAESQSKLDKIVEWNHRLEKKLMELEE